MDAVNVIEVAKTVIVLSYLGEESKYFLWDISGGVPSFCLTPADALNVTSHLSIINFVNDWLNEKLLSDFVATERYYELSETGVWKDVTKVYN